MPLSPSKSPLYLLAQADRLTTAYDAVRAGADAVLCPAQASLGTWTNALTIPVVAGIRRFHAGTAQEVEQALAHGASGIALPGAYSAGEVDTFVRLVRQRADTLISVETETLLAQTDALRPIPWTHLHVSKALWDNDRDRPEEEIAEREANLRAVPRCVAGRSFGTGSLQPSGYRLTAAERIHLTSMMEAGGSLVMLDLTHSPDPEHIHAYVRAVRELWSPKPVATPSRPVATFHRNRLAQPTA